MATMFSSSADEKRPVFMSKEQDSRSQDEASDRLNREAVVKYLSDLVDAAKKINDEREAFETRESYRNHDSHTTMHQHEQRQRVEEAKQRADVLRELAAEAAQVLTAAEKATASDESWREFTHGNSKLAERAREALEHFNSEYSSEIERENEHELQLTKLENTNRNMALAVFSILLFHMYHQRQKELEQKPNPDFESSDDYKRTMDKYRHLLTQQQREAIEAKQAKKEGIGLREVLLRAVICTLSFDHMVSSVLYGAHDDALADTLRLTARNTAIKVDS